MAVRMHHHRRQEPGGGKLGQCRCACCRRRNTLRRLDHVSREVRAVRIFKESELDVGRGGSARDEERILNGNAQDERSVRLAVCHDVDLQLQSSTELQIAAALGVGPQIPAPRLGFSISGRGNSWRAALLLASLSCRRSHAIDRARAEGVRGCGWRDASSGAWGKRRKSE